MLVVLLGGCAGDEGGGPTDPPSPSPMLFVSAATGVDSTATGDQDAPFRTLTAALRTASDGDIVSVAGGIYDASLGEVFPIYIPADVRIAATSQLVRVEGGVEMAGQATLTSGDGTLQISNPGGIAIYASGSSALVDGVEVIDSATGILAAGTTRLNVFDCTISRNADFGISYLDSAGGRLFRNEISHNGIGVAIWDHASPDLGRSDSPGENVIRENDDAGVCNEGTSIIQAQGNFWGWDEFDFTVAGTCREGVEIGNTFTGAVIFQETPPDGILFQGAERIELVSPASGAILQHTRPRLEWTSGCGALVFAAIFDELPRAGVRTVTNSKQAIWAWHSGLPTSGEGGADFADGVRVVDGIVTTQPPDALAAGRTYYWCVWAWDDRGIEIICSSPVEYFVVRN